MSKTGKYMTDMTAGKPMSHIFIFAIPLFIGTLFQQLYSIVDIMIVGYSLGDNSVAAIGVTATLYGLIFGMVTGMNNGFVIVLARILGTKDGKRLKNTIAIIYVFELILAAVFTAISILSLEPSLLYMNTPSDIYEEAYQYAFVVYLGLLFTLFNNMLAGILISVGNSKLPLFFLGLSTVINIFLDWLFIVVFNMGVVGAALATVLAQVICVGLFFRKIHKKYPELRIGIHDFIYDKKLALELFTSGLSMALMSVIFQIGSVILQGAINVLGTATITANTAARKIIELFMQPLITLATANAIFVSQNYGAEKYSRIFEAVRKTNLAGIIWSVFAFIVVYIFATPLIAILTGTTDELVISNGVLNLTITMPFFLFVGVLITLRTSLQSVGRKISPLVSSLFELIIKVAAAMVLVPNFGYAGASFAEPISWVVCTLFITLVFWRFKNKAKQHNDPLIHKPLAVSA